MTTRTMADIAGAKIVREGTINSGPWKGQRGLCLQFKDGAEGVLPRDYVLTIAQQTKRDNADLLARLGFKPDGMVCVAGVWSSIEYTHPDGRRVTLETANMGNLPAEFFKHYGGVLETIRAAEGV